MYYSDELYHHGIKGQRWGRRNGPPYPLSAQTHAAVVRSAGRGSSNKRGRVGGYDDEDKAARRRKIVRNIAIGAGAAAALGGAGYLAYKKLRRGGYQQPLLKDNTNGLRLTANRPALTGQSVGGKYSGLGKARMRNGKRVSSLITPEVGSGRKFRFSTRSSSTALAVPNRNTQLAVSLPTIRRRDPRDLAIYGAGAAALGGGTAYGINRYRKRKRSRR